MATIGTAHTGGSLIPENEWQGFQYHESTSVQFLKFGKGGGGQNVQHLSHHRSQISIRRRIHYVLVRIDLEYGKPKLGAIRLVYERLGTRHRAEKFFKQLGYRFRKKFRRGTWRTSW